MTPASPEPVAVILAAGRGTRMGSLTDNLPKPLVPVLGRPALHHVVDALADSGVRRYVIVTGYLSSMVRDAMATYRTGELHYDYVHQSEQLGTAHALRLTREAAAGAPVVLAFADIITSPGNYAALIRQFHQNHCHLTAGVRNVGDPWRAAAVYFDEHHNISSIVEKPAPGTSTTPWAHAGMYCFANTIYDYADRVPQSARGEYEITDAVSAMINDNLTCQAVELHGYWKDLATPADITEAEDLIRLQPA